MKNKLIKLNKYFRAFVFVSRINFLKYIIEILYLYIDIIGKIYL